MKKLFLFLLLFTVFIPVFGVAGNEKQAKGESMYIQPIDILEMAEPVKIAKTLRVDVPDTMKIEERNSIYEKLSNEEKTLFDKFYILDINRYKLNVNNSEANKIALVTIFFKTSENKILDRIIEDSEAEINLALTSSGYITPVSVEKPYFNIVRNWTKKLTMYYLILGSGIKNESTAEKEFLEIGKGVKQELEKLTQGKLKLALSNDSLVIKTPQKTCDWSKYEKLG